MDIPNDFLQPLKESISISNMADLKGQKKSAP